MIALVVAMDEHGLIGRSNGLPWHCAGDLQHFYQLTKHHHLLMGRVTFQGLPHGRKDCCIHVATHTYMQASENVYPCYDVDTFLLEWKAKDDILYVCGGAQLYAYAIPYADEYWCSIIAGIYEGDTYMPRLATSCFAKCTCVQKEGFVLYHYTHRKKGIGE